MSTFYRHPIGLLAYNPQDPHDTQRITLHWCIYDVGNSAFGDLAHTDLIREAKSKDINSFQRLSPRSRDELLTFLGACILGVTFHGHVRGVAADYEQAEEFLRTVSESARKNRVNVSNNFFWDCLYTLRGEPIERSLNWREYRVLCALLSKIGAFKYQRCGWREIQARACGWCGKSDMAAASPLELERREPLILTRDKIRTSLDRLEADKFFARLNFGTKARESWFSFSCAGDRNKLLEWVKSRKARRAERLIALRRDDEAVSLSIHRSKKRPSPCNPQSLPNINQGDLKNPNINTERETPKLAPSNAQAIPNSTPKPSPTLTIEQQLTIERQSTKERMVIPTAVDGEEGYQMDGVFMPLSKVNEFALSNRDRLLEIVKKAKRAKRSEDGTITLINK